jgi:trans-AT polyketide synthase, acyltransferase and oxidoreductase domains
MTAPTVFMFSGQGSQYFHMGRELYSGDLVFRETLDRLDAFVEQELGASVVTRMYDSCRTVGETFDDTLFTHPAIVMVELALAEALIARGINPHCLLGASLGELTAAALAGVIEQEKCLRLVVRMARSVDACLPGGMLAVLAGPDLYERESALHLHTELAARNFGEHFVVSGSIEGLTAAEEFLAAKNIPFQRLPVRHGFHSRLMDPTKMAFEELFAGVKLHPPRIPLISCAAAGPVDAMTADHLWRVVRQPIEFAATIAGLEERGEHLYLDVGPSGTLHNFVRNNVKVTSRSRSLPLLTQFSRNRQALAQIQSFLADSRPLDPVPAIRGVIKAYGFPGQGSQVKGMGADLFEEFPEYVEEADAILGYSVRELCLDNPNGQLGRTEFTQPALYVVEALAYLRRCKADQEPPAYLIGHSLGEYVALFAAGVFDFATGLKLVQRRGELMSRASEGGMAAVVGCDLAAVEAVLVESCLTGLDIASCNAPDQTVLAGPSKEIDRARLCFEARGAHYVVLNVSAPFHSRYMQFAANEFLRYLDDTKFRPPQIPVIANVDARPYQPDQLKETLARQICSPIQWVDTIRFLMGRSDFYFEELGPGQVLTNLVNKIRQVSNPLCILDVPEAAPAAALAADAGNLAVTRLERKSSPEALSAGRLALVNDRRSVGPEDLGARTFRDRYGLRFAYLAGSMYGGISAKDMIVRLANAGTLGFFGTGGVPLSEIECGMRAALAELGPAMPFGANLLYQYAHPGREKALVDLLLQLGVGIIEASGFPRITPALAKYRLKGGRILAKVSRASVAEMFLKPAPRHLVSRLVEQGEVTTDEAKRVGNLPMADDLCVEEYAGWNSTIASLATHLPAILRIRNAHDALGPRVHVGAAGGIGTPEAAAAAFVLGAEFIVMGSVNQCTMEAATSPEVKKMLQGLTVDDTGFAPSSEMFEFGIRTRMVKRGVFFPARANRLYELWRQHNSFEAIDRVTRRLIEEKYLLCPFDDAYAAAKARLRRTVPEVDARTMESPKEKLALAFRHYFDRGFELALAGDPSRRVDYLIYCGPAMGAFNHWVQGTKLEPWEARHVDLVAQYLMEETARLLRNH